MNNLVVAAQSLDLVSLGTNLGIFLGFIAAALLGLKKGVKLLGDGDKNVAADGNKVSAATILENQSLLFWSDSNRAVAEGLAEVKSALYSLRESLDNHSHVLSANQREMVELRHQIEMLRSKMR